SITSNWGGDSQGSGNPSDGGGYSNGGSNSCNWGSIASDGGGVLSDGGGIASDGSSNTGYWGGVSSYGSGDLSDGGSKRSLVDDSVESVDGVSGVFDSADGTVGFHKAVASLDNITVTALLLALGITGKSVLDVVSEAVLGMRVEVGVDGYLSDGGGGIGDWSMSGISDWGGISPSSQRGTRGHNGGGSQETGPSDGYDSSENEELE
ncbi:hypothetical protein C0J52_10495, partial [Blattella germanica]